MTDAEPEPEAEPEAAAAQSPPETEPEPAPEAPAAATSAATPTLPLEADRVGGLMFAAGALTIPLGLGAGLGYWASDRGVLWMPTMLLALTGVWLAALVVMLAGSYRLGPGSGRPTHRKRIIALGAGIVILAGLWVAIRVADQDAPLTSLTIAEFYRAFEEDARQYRDLDRSLDGLIENLERQEGLKARAKPPVLSADEESAVLDAWQAYVQCTFALDRIRSFHEDYFRFDASRAQRDRHLRSFLLTFAAELAVYHHTACLVEVVDRNPNVIKFLNVERPKRGIPKDSLAFVREEMAGLTDVSRVVAGRAYLRWLDATLGAQAEARRNGYGWLWDEVERRLGELEQRHPDKLRGAVAADFAPIKRKLKAWSMPIQKSVAEMMGDTKVRRRGRYLITQAQLDELQKELAPGDVMLGRKNWYLSNIGLPGFWPHAMLYVGTNAQLVAAFDADETVQAWVKATSGGKASAFSALLALRYPKAWARRVGAPREHPLTVIEAVSEGVLQHSLRKASGDYLAVLRPRLSPLAKAQAVEHAFGYLGRPYDFDFDFATDDKLVCSELVWRSYRPRGEVPGLRFQTVTTVGRETVPPQEIARRFLEEHGTETRQMDFVCFLEGNEKSQTAVRAGLDAFLKTPKRSKWDFTQR